MPNKALTRGTLWRLLLSKFNKKLIEQIIGCIDQRMKEKSFLALVGYAKINDGCIDLVWHTAVGYRAVNHVVKSLLIGAQANASVEWSVDVKPEDPSFADTLLPQEAGAGAALSAAASSVATGEAPHAKLTPPSDSNPEASSKPPKRARLTAAQLPGMGVTLIGSDTNASAGGVPPQHCEAPSWLFQKALKLVDDVELDDTEVENYALGGAPPYS